MEPESPTQPLHVLLLSTYDLGRQPFGLASPAAWLREAGHRVRCVDLAVDSLDESAVRCSALIAIHLPMHTATRIALELLPRIRALNPRAELCSYGLYAPLSAARLHALGVRTLLGGEFESGLVELADRLARDTDRRLGGAVSSIDVGRQRFRLPERDSLPELTRYAHLHRADNSTATVGYTEASRGCKHHCRHCPVVPVYRGRFRVVQRDVVLDDIRQQVERGARHITFGDPDFFNGVGHAARLVRELHRRHPGLSYDVTIKVEHLLRHARYLPLLRDTGCLFVTSAVESLDDRVLRLLDKGHTREDFLRLVSLCREIGLGLNPTFVAFHPWLTRADYRQLLQTLYDLELVDRVAPVQLSLRLLITGGSRLLELEQVRERVGPFDERRLVYPWRHPDPAVDELQRDVQQIVERAARERTGRRQTFAAIWECAGSDGAGEVPKAADAWWRQRAAIPYLNEPWYC